MSNANSYVFHLLQTTRSVQQAMQTVDQQAFYPNMEHQEKEAYPYYHDAPGYDRMPYWHQPSIQSGWFKLSF